MPVSKYADHLRLYRQSQIYAREGLDLDRSTLADWVGGASALLEPLVSSLGRYVMSATKLHGDDTPVPVLCLGRGTTKQGRLWTYVRDDRPAASTEPPAVLFPTPPIARASAPRYISCPLPECCRRMPMPTFVSAYWNLVPSPSCLHTAGATGSIPLPPTI